MVRTIAAPRTGEEHGESRGIGWRSITGAALSLIASVLQRMWGKIRTARLESGAEITQPLDIDHVAEHLRIVERAQEDGRRNLPPPGEEAPAGAQHEIIAYFTNLRRRARQRAAEAIEKANGTLEQIRDSDELAKVRDLPAACESKILRYLADVEPRLQACAEREQNQKRHYDAFRQGNKLDRVATYPDVALLYYLAVPMLIAALAYVSANLLVPGTAGSSDLSVTWSGMISAVVVIVPFMLGIIALRSINHVNDFRKLGGWIGAIATVATTLAIARYADFHIAAVMNDPNASSRDVFGAMLATPIDVVSGVASWQVFGVFVLTGLLSMFLGYRSDDIYPGYGAVQRTYYRARKEREDLLLRLRKRISALVDQAEAEVIRVTGGYKARARDYSRMLRRATQFPSLLNDYDVELEDACNIVLDRYRAANLAARSSEAPISFTERVCFDAASQIPSGSPSGSRSDVDEVQNSVIELEKAANLAVQRLRALDLKMISSVAGAQRFDPE